MTHKKTPEAMRADRIISLYAKDALGVVFVYAAGQIGVLLALGIAGINTMSDAKAHPIAVLVSYIFGSLTMLAVLYAALVLIGHQIRSLINFKRPNYKDIMYIFLGYGVYSMLLFVVMGLLSAVVPENVLSQKQNLGISQNLGGIEMILAYIALAILPPVVEEFLFRGFLYGRLLTTKLQPLVSALIVSVLFGLVHRQLNVAIDTFLLSMVIIYTFSLRNRNIWVAIGIHSLKNTVAYLGLFVFKINIG